MPAPAQALPVATRRVGSVLGVAKENPPVHALWADLAGDDIGSATRRRRAAMRSPCQRC
ncbi:hypothetical protein [Bordetella sp. 2513F-2]